MARIAFIVDDMFEDSEFRVPYDRVKEAGHEPVVVGTEAGRQISGKKGQEQLKAEAGVKEVSAGDFDALVIPGGYSPDKLRMNADMVQLVRDFNEAHKPIAAVCHAGWMLAEANIARGLTLTSWPSLKTDLINAGAHWVDREVVVDGNIITSRKPEDLQSFSDALLIQLRGETLPHPRVVPAPSPDLREQVDHVGPH